MNNLINKIANNWKLDANLEDGRYFYHHNEVNSILRGDICYVIGRKGMGKSAICRYLENIQAHNVFALKLTFKNFPFNELYSLQDSGYTQPNQYITLWKYLIYVTVCKLLTRNESITFDMRKKLKELFPENTVELLARDIKRWTSVSFNITALSVGVGASVKRSTKGNKANWIERVDVLEDLIAHYAGDAKYYIVFDELDEDYRSIKEKAHLDLYIPLLTGLFKAVQSIKSTFFNKQTRIYPVVFLRDDIYSQIIDADKNKWSDLKIELNWSQDELKNLLAYRISQDFNDGSKTLSFKNAWDKIMYRNIVIHYGDEKKKTISPFDYIIKSTQLRPRDLIEYVKCCCQLAIRRKTRWINETIIQDVDRAFSNYFKAEMQDEIYPVLPDIENIFQVFSVIGKWNLKVSEFREKYHEFVKEGTIKEANVDYVLETLFDFSVIGNQHKRQKDVFFFKFKQTNMKYNKEENIILHRGLFKALQIL